MQTFFPHVNPDTYESALRTMRLLPYIFEANFELLSELGARLGSFSPLDHGSLPDSDALWLPGGYAELQAAVLSENPARRDAIRAFHDSRRPILEECGGSYVV